MALYDATGGPPWAVDPSTNFGRVLFTTRLAADANLEKLEQGIMARMPGIGDPSATPYLCDDYVITRGQNESTEQITHRLSHSCEAWRAAGSRRAVLEQVFWFFYDPSTSYPGTVPVYAIVGGDGETSTWETLYNTSDPAAPVRAVVDPPNFSWDGLTFGRRAWCIIYEHLLPTSYAGISAYVDPGAGGLFSIDGLYGAAITGAQVGMYITLSGCASPQNNGTWQIVAINSDDTITAAIPGGVAPDANNANISWSIGYFPGTAPAPVCGCPGLTCDADTSSLLGQFHNAVVTCGLSNPPDLDGLVAIIRQWKSRSTWYPMILFSFGGGDGTSQYELNPNSPHGPAGTWGEWPRVTSAPLGWALAPCDGTGAYINATVPTDT